MRIALTLAAGLLALVAITAAFGHSEPVRFNPAPGQVLATAPQRVDGWFTQEMRRTSDRPPLHVHRVMDRRHARATPSAATSSSMTPTATTCPPMLTGDLMPGQYVVAWSPSPTRTSTRTPAAIASSSARKPPTPLAQSRPRWTPPRSAPHWAPWPDRDGRREPSNRPQHLHLRAEGERRPRRHRRPQGGGRRESVFPPTRDETLRSATTTSTSTSRQTLTHKHNASPPRTGTAQPQRHHDHRRLSYLQGPRAGQPRGHGRPLLRRPHAVQPAVVAGASFTVPGKDSGGGDDGIDHRRRHRTGDRYRRRRAHRRRHPRMRPAEASTCDVRIALRRGWPLRRCWRCSRPPAEAATAGAAAPRSPFRPGPPAASTSSARRRRRWSLSSTRTSSDRSA